MTDLVLLSDLHLGPGYDPGRGGWDPLEPFFYDDAFARFIDHLIARARHEGRSLRLVLLGDLLDFRLIGLVRRCHGDVALGTTAAATRAVAAIARGHPKVFTALGRLLSAGFDIDIVVGNHDVELVSPAVQHALRETLMAHAHDESPGEVRFHPWIYYVPGVLYAEHGHQYQPLEAFATVLTPQLPGDGDTFEPTLGAFLYRYLLNLDVALDPCPDHETPPWRYFRLVARRDPAALLATLPLYGRLLNNLVQHSVELSQFEAEARRNYGVTLAKYAAELGLPEDVVWELDALSPAASRSATTRLAGRLRPPVSGAVGVVAATGLLATGRRVPRRLALGASAAAGLALVGTRRLRSAHPGRASYLQRAALSVHGVLARRALDVPAYVFGHSHEPQHLPLELGAEGAQYLNTGTWSSLVATPREPLGSPFRPTFVHVAADPARTRPAPRLLLWNDAIGTIEPMRTQA